MLVNILCGCVEVYQLVKMNRDGSGKLIERVKILPRTVRLLEGRKVRTGTAESGFKLLTDEAIQHRMKAFGDVTLVDKKINQLPDGSIELQTVYEFKDINKVTFWIAPTFACTDKNNKGNFKLKYQRVVWRDWEKKHYHMDLLSVEGAVPPSQSPKFSSPYLEQDYRRLVPVFQDMLKDFRFELQVQAPPDLEQFEDHSMVNGMPFNGNTVTVYRVYGENVTLDGELIRSFLMGEIRERIHLYEGQWRRRERALPETITPYGREYTGMSVRFLKTIYEAKPENKDEQK
jgi:hypothetical protein